MWYKEGTLAVGSAALISGALMFICRVVALHASPLVLRLSGACVTLSPFVFGYCPACPRLGASHRRG